MYWLAIVALTLAVAGPVAAEGPSQPPPPSGGEQSGPKQEETGSHQKAAEEVKRSTETPPLIVKVFNTPNSPSDPEAANSKTLEKPTPDWGSPEWAIVWATLGLAAVAILQVVMFLLQLRYMRVSMNDARIAAEAARDAAKAATEGNKISRDNMIASRRAWLSIEKVSLRTKTIITDDAGFFVMEVTIKNFSETPALSAWISINACPNGDGVRRINTVAYECRESARSVTPLLGATIFPQNKWTQQFMWSVTARPDESYKSILTKGDVWNVLFPIAVSYRIVGDDMRHITYRLYDLAMPVQNAIGEDEEWVLSPGIVSIDEID
jgi:hypothetical protein